MPSRSCAFSLVDGPKSLGPHRIAVVAVGHRLRVLSASSVRVSAPRPRQDVSRDPSQQPHPHHPEPPPPVRGIERVDAAEREAHGAVRQITKLAVVAHLCYHSPDLAGPCIVELQRRKVPGKGTLENICTPCRRLSASPAILPLARCTRPSRLSISNTPRYSKRDQMSVCHDASALPGRH